MAKKSITKSKPAPKQFVKKYQFAGANYSNYIQQVTNPYYVSGTFAEQAAQEADRYYNQAGNLGNTASDQAMKIEQAKKEEAARLKEVKAETKAANKAEVRQASTEALASGTDLAKGYFKQRAAQKAAEQAATNTIANAAMQAGTAGVWAPVASAATPTAASIGLNTLPTMSAAYAPAASAATTAGTLLPGAVEVGSQVGQAAAGTAAGSGAAAGAGSAAGTAVGTGANAAGTGASIGTGLATAGVGLGLNIGGTLLEKSGDDNDYTTFTKKEKNRNLVGSAMKSAGTGVGVGATIGSVVPGIGNVAGAVIGGLVGGTAGLVKGIKENKESREIADEYKKQQNELAEADRKRMAEINRQGNLLAQRYNTANVNSRLTGMQTGFGYNTSTNMNMQPTSSFYGKTGGKLPGGHMVPIGDDAIKFVGRKHSEGGIKLDPQTEVEGGETMDKVMMNGGKPNDYFFSAYLKLGGKSFAKRHEELIKAGASQKEIQDLAKKQEAVANKKGEKDRGPEQIAKYGGIHEYRMAGPEESAMAQSNMDAKNVTLRDANKANAKAPSPQQSVAPGGTTNNAGQASRDAAARIGTKDSSAISTSIYGNPITKQAKGYGGVRKYQTAGERLYGREDIEKGNMGISKSMEKVPVGQGDEGMYFGNVSNDQFTAFKTNNAWFDFNAGFDPKKRDYTSAKGVKGSSDVAKFQEEYNKHVGEGNKLQVDGKLGEQTATAMLMFKDPEVVTPEPEVPEVPENPAPPEPPVPPTPPVVAPEIANVKKGVNGSVLAGLGQLIPVGYAMARPYKTEGNLPRMQGAGNVGAGSVRGALLPRVNMNAERAAAERNTVAVKNAIQNANAGPGGIAAMMAANASQNEQGLKIANQEQEANKQLAAEEARLGQQASQFNAEAAQRANIANVQNRLAVNQANLEAGIQERKLKIDEKRYKREEILGALDTASSRIAGIVKDERALKSQERLAKALDDTGSYDRFAIYEQLKKDSQRKDSAYYGKTDAELKKIASNTYNEFAGSLGNEADNKKKMGGIRGTRRYTSRLGDLNRGRNKRNFNI